MIPCMMMVLGAVLHKGPGSVNVPPRLIVGVSAFRLIIIPLAGAFCILLHGSTWLRWCAKHRIMPLPRGSTSW